MIEVRPMAPGERDEVRALLIEAYAPYTSNIVPALYKQYMSHVLNLDDGLVLAATDGSRVLGSARLFTPGTVPVPLPPDWAWVRAVGVRPEAHGAGVGQALMDYSAKHSGSAAALALHTMDFMPAAVRLYERIGYVRAPEWDLQVGKKAGFPPEEQFTAIAYCLVK